MTLMHKLIIVKSSLIGKSVKKKIDRRGLHEFDECYVKRKIKLLTMGIAHDFSMGEIIKCRKT
jgi:hypothetical protein